MTVAARRALDARVLLLAANRTGHAPQQDERSALASAAAALAEAGLACVTCDDMPALCDALQAGAGALLLSEEALLADDGRLDRTLREQPAWSAVPAIVLARAPGEGEPPLDSPSESAVRLTWIDRPAPRRTLVSVVAAALRAREHQYRIRDAMAEHALQAAALQEKDEHLHFTLAAAELGWWELDLATGQLECSDTCKLIYGRPMHEPFTFATLFEVIHPADVKPVRAAIDRALAQATSYDVEYRVVCPDGEVRWVLVRGRASLGADGRPVRAAGLALDITDRKRATAELREKDERLSLVVDNVRDYAFLVLALDGRIVEWLGGATAITGWSAEQAVGQLTHFIFTPEDRAAGRPEQEMLEAATTGRAVDKRWHLRRDGGRFFADGVLVALRDESGELRGFGKVFQDVSDRKRAEEQLQASERALQETDRRKDEFLATLAHELRNPLAPIRNGLQVLQRAPEGEVAARTRQMMERQVHHMVRLIDDLLDISRITRGRVELKLQRVALRTALEAALESSRPLLDAAGHTLHVHLPRLEIWLDVDVMRVAQVIGNLLNNAAKYTPHGGEITVQVRREADEAVLEVHDNGIGIPPDKLSAVFELFAQIHQALDRAQGGLGIGLALVRKLLEMHGGTITAASAGLGKGSTFTMRLPVAPDPVEDPGAADPAAAAEPSRRRVLVVDDNVDIADTAAMLVEFMGHETRIAHNGADALTVASSFRPDAVLLDIGLPGLNGYEVARRMRADPELATALLIAVTGWGTDEDKRQAALAGFDHHLTKPVDADQLEALLRGGSRKPAR